MKKSAAYQTLSFILAFLSPFVCLFILDSCSTSKKSSRSAFCMDTVFTYTVYGDNMDPLIQELKDEADRIENVFSKTIPESALCCFNNAGATYNNELIFLLKLSSDYSSLLNGCFDPLLGSITELWDFNTESPALPSPAVLENALAQARAGGIEFTGGSAYDPNTASCAVLTGGSKVDLGGIVKGYAADRFVDILQSKEVSNALVSLGGNILAYGDNFGESYSIGIRDPSDAASIACILKCSNSVISVSGGYERFFIIDGKKYHHIIDPDTGYPAESDLASAAVISDISYENAGAFCDALSTALFVMGYEKASEISDTFDNFGIILIKDDGSIYASKNLSASLSAYGQYKDNLFFY